ncbi:hypothetical protein, partial [Oleiphilus sp. HI0080]
MKLNVKASLLKPTIAIALALCSLSVAAVERDGVKLSVGAFFSDIDSSIGSALIGGNTDLQGQASFEADLRLQDSSTQPVFDLEWNFKKAHMLSLNYFSL